jgi:hypothetical protein
MTLPKPYTDLIKSFNEHYNAREKAITDMAQDQLKNIREARTKNEEVITKATQQFLEIGIHIYEPNTWSVYEKPHRQNGGHYHTPISKYLRELAHYLGRPYIDMPQSLLNIPKLKKLDVLTVPFMMVAQKTDRNAWNTYALPAGVWELNHYASKTSYYFKGEVGEEMRKVFLEYIKAPECKKALGILQG